MTALPKGSRIVGGVRETVAAEIVEKYRAGASIRVLAQEYGRSYGFIHRILTDANVDLRGRGGANRRKKE